MAFNPAPGSLNYLVIACLTPLVSEFAGVVDEDDRELALGETRIVSYSFGCYFSLFCSSFLR